MTGDHDDVMLVAGDWRVSRGEYRSRVARAVSVLRDLGVGAGDIVGVALRNCPQFFEVAAAAGLIQARTVAVAWRLKQDEVRYLVEDSHAKLVVHDADSAEAMAGLPGLPLDDYERRLAAAVPADVDPDAARVSMQLYSSGTTGRPKAIDHQAPAPVADGQAARPAGSSGLLSMLGVAQRDEVHMMCGPLYHSQPVGFANAALAAGHRVVMMGGSFDAEACLATIAREKVTWITCVPTHLIRMLALPEDVRRQHDLSSLKAVLHSAAPCPPDVKRAIIDWFPPDTVWEVYGGTEGGISMISPGEWLNKPGSVGRPFPPGAPLKILDAQGDELPVGEAGLIYAKPMVRFRYRGADAVNDQTFRGDLYTLGDIGYLDADGYLFITDRQKDMIISGGANIYPAEVEAVLFNHPAIGDVAVIGTPDPQWGEKVKAIVERKGEATAEEIITFCRANLAHYKCPTSIDFVDTLPRDPNGKVRKRELREAYWADAGRAV